MKMLTCRSCGKEFAWNVTHDCEGTPFSTEADSLAVDYMVSFRWSQEDVKRYAMEINSPILYQAVKSYEAGNCTWEVAMQVAAVTLARHCAEITKQHIDLMQRQPAPMILKES